MKIKCLHSGSDGNCHLLQTGNEILILECGISMKDIKIGLNFNLMNVVGAVVSHIHADHSKSIDDFKKIGIPVFTPYEQAIKKPKKHHYGSFYVTALPMLDKNMEHWQHTNGDGSECPCYAFLIEVEDYKILYVTDTKLCVWNLRKMNLTHMMIGLDYEPEKLSRQEFKTRHILSGHLGRDTAIDIIKANRTDRLQAVYLCHMSAGNTDKDKCVQDIKKATDYGIYVDYAVSGKEWEIRNSDECPF